MTIMTLWPSLITGTVGVAGIAGTILAAQLTARNQTANLAVSINEERNRSRLSDKRQVYANFMTSLHENLLAWTLASYAETDTGERAVAILGAMPGRVTIYNRLSELELIGSEEVISQARALAKFVGDFFNKLTENADTPQLPVINSFDAQYDQMEKQLYKAMRADLGVESVSLVESAEHAPARTYSA